MSTIKNHTRIFKKMLMAFIAQEDPISAMLKCINQQMMQKIEAGAKNGNQEGRAQPRA